MAPVADAGRRRPPSVYSLPSLKCVYKEENSLTDKFILTFNC